jgi:hypothetical protein
VKAGRAFCVNTEDSGSYLPVAPFMAFSTTAASTAMFGQFRKQLPLRFIGGQFGDQRTVDGFRPQLLQLYLHVFHGSSCEPTVANSARTALNKC